MKRRSLWRGDLSISRLASTVLASPIALALTFGGSAALFAVPAEAQMRMNMSMRGGMGGGTQSKLTKPHLEQYMGILGMDETQKAAATELHGAYEAEFDTTQRAMRDRVEKIRQEFEDTRDPSIWGREMPKIGEEFGGKMAKLQASLMGDLKSLLTPDQAGKWSTVERAVRRNESLPSGMLSGESVDMTTLVRAASKDPLPETVVQTIDRYEIELDAALVERDAKRKELSDKMPQWGQGGGMPDMAEMTRIYGEIRKTGIKVRDLNDRYASVIEAAMPEAVRSDFADRFRREKFPQIYRDPYVLRAMNAAVEYTDLSTDKKTMIEDAKKAFQRDVGMMNEKLARLQGEAEKDGGGDDMAQGWMRMMGGGQQGNDDSELSQTRRAKRKLENDTLDKLRSMLTPEQVDRLPERESDRWFNQNRRN